MAIKPMAMATKPTKSMTTKRDKVVTYREELQLIKPYDPLTLSWRRSLLYRNQSIDLQIKSMDWFLCDRDLRHERVNRMAMWDHATN